MCSVFQKLLFEPGRYLRAFRTKKFSHHSVPSTYVHNIRHFELLLCWTHVADWSTDDAGGAGQCRYPVGEKKL
jgi:hypothetical protein